MTLKPIAIVPADPQYPSRLREYLADESPKVIELLGNADLLRSSYHKLGLFSSAKAPQGLIALMRELTGSWREALGLAVISGFHSPIENEAFKVLTEGESPIIFCPPRSLIGMNIKASWRMPLSQGRLLILSFFTADQDQATLGNASYRNRCIAALADQVVIAFAGKDSKTAKLAAEMLGWDKYVYCPEITENHLLFEIGACPLPMHLSDDIHHGPAPIFPDRSATINRLSVLSNEVNASIPHRNIFHYALQTKIIDLAHEFGFQAMAEYPVENVLPNNRTGRIDVVWLSAVKPVLAIEIDNRRRLKSIQKLLGLDANLKVWIYRGPHDPHEYLSELDPEKSVVVIWLDPPKKQSKPDAPEMLALSPIPKSKHHYRVAITREQYPNAYQSWTEAEESTLEREFSAGATFKELSNLLQRKPSAIRNRVKKLGMTRD